MPTLLVGMAALALISLQAFAASSTSTGCSPCNLGHIYPKIEVSNDPGMGLEVSDVRLNLDTNRLSGAKLKIKNTSRKSLVAFAAGLDIFWKDREKSFHTAASEDAWFLNGTVLLPGQTKQLQLATTVTLHKPVHVLKVIARADFAQFSDGHVTGPEAGSATRQLMDTRKVKLRVWADYAGRARSGVPTEALLKSVAAELTQESLLSREKRTALLQMQIAYELYGDQGFRVRLLEEPLISLQDGQSQSVTGN